MDGGSTNALVEVCTCTNFNVKKSQGCDFLTNRGDGAKLLSYPLVIDRVSGLPYQIARPVE
jgi:hypothetical protein